MKKVVFLFFLILMVVACNTGRNNFIIEGTVTNAADKYIYLSKLGAQQIELLDSTKLNSKGKFRFSVDHTSFPEFYFLGIGASETLTLLSDSTGKITVTTEYPGLIKHAEIIGSKESRQILEADKKLMGLRAAYEKYKTQWNLSSNEDEKRELVDGIVAKIKQYKKEVGQMITENPRSFFGYYVLYQRLDDKTNIFNPYDKDDFTYYGMLATSLNIFYPNAPRTKALYAKVEDAIAVQRRQKIERLMAEASDELPDISMPDVKGDTIHISSLRGKLVVLNYWMSSDKASRQMNRELKSIYNRYRWKGLEIFQCSLDKSKILWEVAVEEDQINWTTLCDLKGSGSRSVWLYNVKELPTNYLIDKKGKLVGKFNDPAELENKIKAML